ncbi:YveK family protein [Tannockella kyphosi]|uniref:YveK family protein n=1 Tax=Tannockella kyphosi TaxID=2899121 RepID=UPI002013142C|nr:Wzz/FepE/Etk N-terminal domain-containing protein [Tannockella kyphosi]
MEDDIFIDLSVVFKTMLKKSWIIAIATILGATAMFGYSSFVKTPLYEADVKLYVNNSTFSLGSTSYSITSGELSAAQSLIETYIVILETRTVINEIIDEGNYDYTYEEMLSMISAASVNSTEVFSVTVTNESASEAADIANTIGTVLPDCISDVVDGSDVRIVDYAVEAVNQVYPVVLTDTIKGAMIGFVLVSGIILLQILFDSVIRSQDYISQTYDYPILASIPEGETKGGYYGGIKTGKKGGL